ncbi:MAG: hypothetical protein N2Z40_02715 [Caldimicrobium sp.]|nr:hypothetical protein [Caldimicrobium sp.]MCX7613119.1 hypothetical protein [Caldimicrobium sp.]MDW8183274.1 hypothetical protein [Caldimicrobium sp.]
MHLSLEVYIPGEEFNLKAREIRSKRDVSFILIIFLLVLIEVPIFIFLLWKIAPTRENLLLWLTLFVLVTILIFSLVILFSPSRVYMIRAVRQENLLEVSFVENFFRRKRHLIPAEEIKGLHIQTYNFKGKNATIMCLERKNQRVMKLPFSMDLVESKEKLARIFLNLAQILNLKAYSARELPSGLHLVFQREFSEEARYPTETQELILEKDDTYYLLDLKIPQVRIEEQGPMKIVFRKNPNFWDIMRLIGVFIVFPVILVFISFTNEPGKPFLFVVVLLMYAFILHQTRNLLSPMSTIVDRIHNRLIICKPFFKKTLLLSEVVALEIRDQLSKRTGTVIFHLEAKLRGGKRYQLLYTEIPNEKERIYEVLGQIGLLIQKLEKMLEIATELKLKSV